MIRVRPAASRGRFRNAWLDARFSFSFGGYRDPDFDGYSDLLVLNDDRVAPGGGFATHSHRDIEAISVPLEGEVEHRDSLGNVATMRPGDVQRMSAGQGISHSEMNASASDPEHHLQFWIAPAVRGIAPGYEQRTFPAGAFDGALRLIVSPDGRDGSLTMHQDARVYRSRPSSGALAHEPPEGRRTYVHVIRGPLVLNGLALGEGDGAIVERERRLSFSSAARADFLLFDLR